MVDTDKLSDDVTVNVLLLLETEGDEDIWIQVLKLSEDTWIVPEQLVSDVLVVNVELSIVSEKVTEMLSLTEIGEPLSEGEVEVIDGGYVSKDELWYNSITSDWDNALL